MKQYKVIRVKLTLEELVKENYEKLENAMNDMAAGGWEVVCTSPEPYQMTRDLLVTFCRDV